MLQLTAQEPQLTRFPPGSASSPSSTCQPGGRLCWLTRAMASPPPVQLAAYKPWWSLTPSTERQTGMPQERQQTKFTYRLLALLALLHGLSATAAWAVPGRARLDPPVRGGSGARGGAAGGPSHPSNSSTSARVAMGFTGLLLVNARRAAVADPDPDREPVELAAVARTGFAGDLNRLDAWEGSAVASIPSLRHICRKAL